MGDKGEPFYAVADLLPPLGIKVRVIWPTKRGVTLPFDCVRWIKHGRTYWSTFVDGSPVNVPPRRSEIPAPYWTNWQHLLGIAPAFWAPPHPVHSWSLPLPAPAYFWREPPPEMAMRYERQEFSAADMAYEAEMASLGLIPDTGRSAGDRPSRVAWQWWRDETKIVFGQDPEHLTLKDCEGRLMRAVALSAAGRVGEKASSVTSQALANAVGEAADYVTDDASVPFRAAQCDRGDNFLEAMRWFTALGVDNSGWRLSDFTREQKILVWRSLAMPLSYAEIGELLGADKPGGKRKRTAKAVTGERVRQIEKEAIERAWRVGARLLSTVAEIEIERLRDRNRKVKIAASETAYVGGPEHLANK